MVLHRITYFESLVKESQKLNVVFLNHAGAPSSLLSDISTIDLLANRKAVNDFLHFSTTHPLVHKITVQSFYKCKKVILTFVDKSELSLFLITRKVRFALNCLPAMDIYKESFVDHNGMLVPSVKHHFEYMMLKNQFNKTMFPDKFKKYFSSLSQSERTEVFRYIQPRFNLVFNSLEDLYTPKGGVHLKITIGLRKQKGNSIIRMGERLLSKSLFYLKNLFTNNKVYLLADGTDSSSRSFSPEKIHRKKKVVL